MACHPCPQHRCACGLPETYDANNHTSTTTATHILINHNLQHLPFASHPLFSLRKYTLLTALLGIVLSFAASGPYYGDPTPPQMLMFLLFLSMLTCFCDVLSYARKKGDNPDEDPQWPRTRFVFMDFLLALGLLVVWWLVVARFGRGWYGPTVVQAYGALAGLVCSILHATAFWKQLMACKHQSWLASLPPRDPCARCGYAETPSSPTTPPVAPQHHSQQQQPSNLSTYAGPSADFRRANVLTPAQSESAMEEGLLIGEEFLAGGGYQTISRVEGEGEDVVVEQPESVVVGKGKGKGKGRKRVGECGGSEGSDGDEKGGEAVAKVADG